MLFLADVLTTGNFLPDQSIKSGKVNLLFGETHSLHATADIDPNKIWDNRVLDGHSCPNRTAGAGVDVRHHADGTAAGERLVQKRHDLSG